MSTGDPAGLIHVDDAEAVVISEQPGERKITARSPMQLFWRRLRRDKVAMVALAFIVVLIFVALAAPLIVGLAITGESAFVGK